MRKLVAGLVATVACGMGPAHAHHSFAMFDGGKLVVLRGSILSFSNMNPHAWISVDAKVNGEGESGRWDIESTAPRMLAAMGISPETLKAGDKVTVAIRPLRDGRRGGSMVFVITPDGVAHGADPKDLGLDAATLKP